jgi:predicted alpha/beta hydrolase family esterase
MSTDSKYAVITHGKGGSPNASWILWLKLQLETYNYICKTPSFPPQDNSKLSDWFIELNKLDLDFSHSTFIAHARGAMALLRWINRLPKNVHIYKIITVSCNFDF